MKSDRIEVDIEKINRESSENVYKLIDKGEEKYLDQVREITKEIKVFDKKIVLVSGPSSAGKTTTSEKIYHELKNLGVNSLVLNMDEFFFDIDSVPLREDGFADIESMIAVDVETIRKCLGEILTKGETFTPQYDFATHKRKKEWILRKFEKQEVIIMEGIHALNPKIIEGLELDKIYKVYVHCSTDFVFKKKKLFHARQLRLLRRIVRDERDRSVPVEDTLSLWGEVCKGEDKNIRPFKETADYMLNSTHFYEPLLYKDLLSQRFEKLKYLPEIAVFLEKFKLCATIPKRFVPKDSLLREFIGND
ncbi:MAG: nucleoside kinase [Clostridia bacterium]|nr:nucleoside kinase [Clostridia bacterium]